MDITDQLIKQSTFIAKDYDPDQFASAQKIANKFETTPTFVHDNIADFQSKAKETDLNDILMKNLTSAPITVDIMSSPDNLSLSQDSIEQIANIERKKREYSFVDDASNMFKSAALGAANNLIQIPQTLPDLLVSLQGTDGEQNILKNPYVVAGAEALSSFARNNSVSNYLKTKQQEFIEKSPSAEADLLDLTSQGKFSDAGRALAVKTIGQIPQLVGLIGTTIVAGPEAGLAYAGTSTATESFQQDMEQGVDKQTAAIASLGKGIIESTFEGIGSIGFIERTISKVAAQSGKLAANEVAKSFATELVRGGLINGTEEFSTSLGQDYVSYITGENPNALVGADARAFESMLVGAASGGALESPAGIFAGLRVRAEKRQTELDVATYEALGKGSLESKVLERAPEKHKEFVQSIVKDGPLENVYISKQGFQEYAQKVGKTDAELAAEMKINVELDKSIETQSDVIVVPTAKMATDVVKTEHYNGLRDDVKFKIYGETQNEINKKSKEITEELKVEFDTAMKSVPKEKLDILETEAKEVGQMVYQKLVNDGNMNGKEARTNAQVLSAFYKTMAAKFNMTPKQVFERYQFNVNKMSEDLGKGQEYFQSSKKDNKDKLGFYSKLISTVEQKMSASQDVNSLKSMLKEIKADEAKWLGLDTFLKGKEKVNKQELLDYLKANELNIEEVKLGSKEYSNEELDLFNKWKKRKVNQGFKNPETGKFERFDVDFYELNVDIKDDFLRSTIKLNPFTKKYELDANATNYSFTGKYDSFETASIELMMNYINTSKKATYTKFSEYKTEGGENYREVLFTLPSEPIRNDMPNFDAWAKENGVNPVAAAKDWEIEGSLKKQYIRELEKRNTRNEYKSSHWDQKNVLAHTRLQDFTDADGNKVLLVDEIQSDWHQDGRKKGYKIDETDLKNKIDQLEKEMKDLVSKYNPMKLDNPERKPLVDQYKELQKQKGALEKQTFGVPDAPFAKNWHEFVFKRILTMAVEQGYDKIAWTKGEQQAERFDLSKTISKVELTDLQNASGEGLELTAYDLNDNAVITQKVKDESEAADYIGKEAAQKLFSKEYVENDYGMNVKTIKDVDLKVGGEGMKGFYDKILVDYAKKLGKKFDSKVQDMELADITVHSMEITDKLKQQVLGQGFELFQNKRGSIQIGNREFNINLFEQKNESTFIHESAHMFLEVMGDLADGENATDEGKQLYAAILKQLNVESREQIGENEQELFARSFEAYLMKGEAPTEALQKVFRRFMTWLTEIYKTVTGIEKEAGFNVNVSPEMKALFDRILASEKEIEIYEKSKAPKAIAPQDAITAVLNEKEALEFLNAVEFARLDAIDQLRAKLMKDVIKKKDKAFNEKYNEYRNEALKTASEMNEFKLMNAIKENTDLRISYEVAKKIDQKYVEFLPAYLFVKDGGLPVETIAEMYGYPNSGAMLEALIPYRKGVDEFADTYAATKMKKLSPELLEQAELSDEAVKAAHNENYRLVKRFELSFLAKQYSNVVKIAADKLIRRMPKTKQVIQQASNIIAQTNVAEIKPHLFQNAERKHSYDAAKYFKQGEFEKAFESKYKEYLNFELYRAALKAQQDIEKSVESFKDNFRRKDEDLAKSRDVDLINVGREILKMYQVIGGKMADTNFLEKLKMYDKETYERLSGLVELIAPGAKNYKQVSYSKFVEMADVVNSIWDLSKSRREIEIAGKKMDVGEIANELKNRVDEINPQQIEEYKKVSEKEGAFETMYLDAKASLTRVEAWATAMGGNFHKYIYQPIADATTAYRLKKAEYMDKYKSLIDQYLPAQDKQLMYEQEIFSSELGAVFKGKIQLLGALLHVGNESNLSKLLEGRGWGEKNPDGTLNTTKWDQFINRMQSEGILTKNDYDFIQGIWDLFEEMKPDVQKAHKKILGYYMNEITANSFQTPFGEYRGGYAPAKLDPNAIENKDIKLKEFADRMGSDASFILPTTGRGATKTRNELFKAPLSVDLGLVNSHIDWAVRFAYIEPASKQVQSVLREKELQATLDQFDNRLLTNVLRPWLDRTSKQTRITQDADTSMKAVHRAAAFMRKSTATAVMTLNVVNAIEQFGGLSIAATIVKPVHLKNSLIDYVTSGKKFVDMIMEKSDFMRSTQGSNIYELNDEINDFLLNPTKFDDIKAFFSKHTYVLQSATQNVVNSVTWVAAYNQSIGEGMSEHDAIKHADSVVRLTQGTNAPEDVSAYETGSQTAMLFKQFTGYFNMWANLASSQYIQTVRELGLKKGAGRLFFMYLTLSAIPAAFSVALRSAASGDADEDKDGQIADDLLANFFGTQAKTVFASMPYAGQALVAGYNQFATKQQYDDRLSLSPAISILESVVGSPFVVYQDLAEKGELRKRTVKDALQFIGYFSQTPVGIIGKPVGYLMDVQSGKARPTGPIDFTRGLVTGKPGSQ